MSFNHILFSISLFFGTLTVSQCSSAQKLESNAPLDFGEVYYQKKAQAVRDLESYLTIFIPIKEVIKNNVELDSVYFKGRSAKLMVSDKTPNVYYGRFVIKPKKAEDIILSSEIKDEHQNKVTMDNTKIPFELLPNQCVISYKQDGKTKYYKISNIKEKRLKDVPMEPNNKP